MFDVVENIPDAVYWDLVEVGDPFVNRLEDALILVDPADVFDDILAVGAVDAQLLHRIVLVLKLLQYFRIDRAPQLLFPTRLLFVDDAGQCDADHNEELLVDVKHQVFEICIHTRLCVDRLLVVREQVIELHDSD